MGSRMDRRPLTRRLTTGVVAVTQLRFFRGPKAQVAMVASEIIHRRAESRGFFSLRAGLTREPSRRTASNSCLSPVMRFAAESSEVRV